MEYCKTIKIVNCTLYEKHGWTLKNNVWFHSYKFQDQEKLVQNQSVKSHKNSYWIPSRTAMISTGQEGGFWSTKHTWHFDLGLP